MLINTPNTPILSSSMPPKHNEPRKGLFSTFFSKSLEEGIAWGLGEKLVFAACLIVSFSFMAYAKTVFVTQDQLVQFKNEQTAALAAQSDNFKNSFGVITNTLDNLKDSIDSGNKSLSDQINNLILNLQHSNDTSSGFATDIQTLRNNQNNIIIQQNNEEKEIAVLKTQMDALRGGK